ncbi:hypothetical protein M758_6G090400 [Ceratodon purpureus]|nr:hypothetical protein M758_6G090400 [Ceratodon purpureus]
MCTPAMNQSHRHRLRSHQSRYCSTHTQPPVRNTPTLNSHTNNPSTPYKSHILQAKNTPTMSRAPHNSIPHQRTSYRLSQPWVYTHAAPTAHRAGHLPQTHTTSSPFNQLLSLSPSFSSPLNHDPRVHHNSATFTRITSPRQTRGSVSYLGSNSKTCVKSFP